MEYDAIIVGARPGGAATAMLLARQGLRVLVVDRGRHGTDTLSTHALMRGSVYLLSQWGLLDRIIDAGTPPIRRTRFDYGVDGVTLDVKPSPGVPALYAPRRTVLDAILVDAAQEAGAEVRYGVTVTGLERDRSGRVVGVTGHGRLARPMSARAGLTIGADGVRSTVASAVGATARRTGTGAGTVTYGYWAGLAVDGYEWFYRPGHTAGIIPTNAGEACVFAGVPAGRAGARPASEYLRLLEAATNDSRFATARPPSRLRTWIGRPSFIRPAHGPGWALVGDAASFMDPLSTHGITDALRDAHVLSEAVVNGRDSLAEYERARDRAVGRLFSVVDKIAGYSWDVNDIQRLLRELSSAMSDELTETIAHPTPRAGDIAVAGP